MFFILSLCYVSHILWENKYFDLLNIIWITNYMYVWKSINLLNDKYTIHFITQWQPNNLLIFYFDFSNKRERRLRPNQTKNLVPEFFNTIISVTCMIQSIFPLPLSHFHIPILWIMIRVKDYVKWENKGL